jgi:hypothetical protein
MGKIEIEVKEAEEFAVEVKGLNTAAPRISNLPLPEPQGEQVTSPITEPPIVAEPYFGQDDFSGAQYTLQKEEPQHRMICFLAAQGNTNTEIAEATGFTTACIAYVKKQPWAQKRIAELQERSGRSAVMGVLQGAALDAAKVIISVINNKDENDQPMGAKAIERAKTANDLLNRLYGVAPIAPMTGSIAAQDLSDAELAATVASGTASKNN